MHKKKNSEELAFLSLTECNLVSFLLSQPIFFKILTEITCWMFGVLLRNESKKSS